MKARNVTGTDRLRSQAPWTECGARPGGFSARVFRDIVLSFRQMGRLCSICAHPEHRAIDEALETGRAFREIAAWFGVSKARCTDIDKHTSPEKDWLFPSLHMHSAGPASGSGSWGSPAPSALVCMCGGRRQPRSRHLDHQEGQSQREAAHPCLLNELRTKRVHSGCWLISSGNDAGRPLRTSQHD